MANFPPIPLSAILGAASTATTQAGIATTAKTDAQTAKTAAEAARDAASASARIYATTAAGIAATTAGQYFYIPSAASGSFSDLYLNNSGTAVYQRTLNTSRSISIRSGVLWGVAGFGDKLPMYLNVLRELIVNGVNISKQVASNAVDLVTLKGRFSTAPTTRSGVALGLAGASNKLGLFIDSAGNPWSRGRNINRRLDDCESLLPYEKYLHPSRDVVMWGDSLTLAMSAWLLAQFDGKRGAASYGIGGQVSEQVFARQGSITTLVTLPNNSIIAAATPVTLSAITPKLISTGSDNASRTIAGSIVSNGVAVPGTLTRTATGAWPSQVETYTWKRTTAGSAITVDGETVFVPDCAVGNDFATNVFWPGRNDISTDVPLATIQAYITNAINYQKARQKRFVLVSCLNADTEYAANMATIAGMTVYPTYTSRYTAIIALNRWMKQTYPNEYIDFRSLMVRSGTGTGQDAIDTANDVPPASLRADGIHPNTAGSQLGAAMISANINNRGF